MSVKINEFTFGVKSIVDEGIKKVNLWANSELNAYICIPKDKDYENLIDYFESNDIGLRLTDDLREIFDMNRTKSIEYIIWYGDIGIEDTHQTIDKCDVFANHLNEIYNCSRLIQTFEFSSEIHNHREFVKWYRNNKPTL